jgi:hypothetical protein
MGLGIHSTDGHRGKFDCMGLVKLFVSRFLRLISIKKPTKKVASATFFYA